jgi:Fe-S cluster biogenesis protein NfuA
MFIQTEATNDPQAMRFLPGRDVTGAGAVSFADAADATRSPLAQRLFAVDGIAGVVLGAGDITVTKTGDDDWQALKPTILRAIMEHFTSNEPVFLAGAEPEFVGDADDDVAAQIRELIDTRIYPAVVQGGGGIAFRGYENGVVLLDLEGAAVGLKHGIENMLRHYVPEVTAVQSYEDYARMQRPEMNTPAAIEIRRLLDDEINPSVAAHGGHIALIDVSSDTAYIRLEGGCQGCGMADVTLKQGIEVAIKNAVPSITAVLDTTDHADGGNPYFQPGKSGVSPF